MTPEILILCATEPEIAPLLAQSQVISKSHTASNLSIIVAEKNGKSFYLLITGPGILNTAHALTVFLETHSVNLIVQAGIAGVFEQSDLGIGDIAVATQERYIHTGVQSDGVKKDPLPFDLIEAMPSTQKGIYLFDRALCTKCKDIIVKHFYKKGIQIGTGPLITVSAITQSFEVAQTLYKTFTPLMEAMEGAGSAHVAALYGRPFLEIRSGSNIVGERNKANWDLPVASQNLSKACTILLNHWG